MNDLSNVERETHFNISADNRKVVEVYSDDPVWIAKLQKKGHTGTEAGYGKVFILPIGCFTIRRLPTEKEIVMKKRQAHNNFGHIDKTGVLGI